LDFGAPVRNSGKDDNENKKYSWPAMKTPTPKIQNTATVAVEEPFISFAHLTACFPSSENCEENQNHVPGFPSSREEMLYETGIFIKLFLRC
jgi:hypothetical protein